MKIDLGIKDKMPVSPCDSPAGNSATKCEEKTHYPTMYVRSDKPLDLPEGEFTFVARGKVISRTERTESRDGEEPSESCSYDIEVYSMDTKSGGDKESDVGASLRKGAQKLMEKKKDEKEY